MVTIEVKHDELNKTAEAITTYLTKQNNEMRNIDAEIKLMLAGDWTGQDSKAFLEKWSGVNADNSEAGKLRTSLKNFADALTACAVLYKEAQEKAYNDANWLPKWIYW